ncbi:DUF4388 domain-containing protein [bacterium]|nr:DUF4388 domain-containing protein [bacterium]
MSFSGNLRTMPFSDLLQFLNANVVTGTLQVRYQQIVKVINFEKGRIISSSSSDPREYLGHFLVSQGWIDEEALRIAMEVQRNSKMLLGKVLVMGGKVDEDEMMRLLRLKSEETVYSLFLWDEGDFTFYHDEVMDKLFIRIALDPQGIIFEGVLRKDEWARIRDIFPHNNVVLEKVLGHQVNINQLDPLARSLFDLVDGKRNIEDLVLATHSVDYSACRALFMLYDQGLLRIKTVLEAPAERKSLGGNYSVSTILNLGRESMEKGRFEEALELLRQIDPSSPDYKPEVQMLLAEAEKESIDEISKVLPPDSVVTLMIPLNQVAHAGLTPEEGFLLSRIDGSWDVNSILSVTPLKEVDVLRLMKKLVDRGIIGVK